MQPAKYTVGETTITKLHELDLNDFTVSQLLPALAPSVLAKHREYFDPQIYDEASGRVFLSLHSWVVEHRGKVILIDTGGGNDKHRPGLKALDQLHGPYLQRLQALGWGPNDIDYVLLTHVHADHVGWNTRWNGTEWVPTFPNATVICSDIEWRYGAALSSGDETELADLRSVAGLGSPVRVPVPGVFEDSMLPIERAGQLRQIQVDGSEVLEGIRYLPAPGHSIDHAAISIQSEGERAVFGGDIMHHPFELYQPELISMFCEFPESARASRRKVVQLAASTGALYFSSHFPGSSVGRISEKDSGFEWKFC